MSDKSPGAPLTRGLVILIDFPLHLFPHFACS